MSGSTIGGVIGGVVGVWIGIGWQAGWAIGSAIGGYVDPQQIQGPRLGDARVQTSRDGIPIPYGWGTFSIAGNVIWQADPIKRTKTEKQGKGGPEVTTEYWTRSYAIGVCEGDAFLLQIYRNKKLVYDARDNETIEEELREGGLTAVEAAKLQVARRAEMAKFKYKCAMYTGSETQDPDPTIEGYLGVDNVPAYPGMAYIVVTDDDSIDGEIAQYDFVVSRCGTVNTNDGWAVRPITWMIQSEVDGRLYVANDPNVWTQSILDGVHVSYVTTVQDRIVLSNRISGSVDAAYSDDYGQTWHTLVDWPAADVAPPIVLSSGRVVVLATHASTATVHYSDDNMATWASVPLGTGGHHIAGDDNCIIVANLGTRIISTNRGLSFGAPISNGFTCTSIGYRDGLFVLGAGSGTAFRWSDDNGATLNTCTGTFISSGQSLAMLGMSDGSWITAVSDSTVQTTDNILRSADGKTGWASVTTPSMYFGGGTEGGRIAARGGEVIGSGHTSSGHLQIIRSIDYGASWSAVTHGYSGFVVHSGAGVAVFPILPTDAIPIPDAPGFYTLPDGTVINPSYETLTPCIPTLAEIVADICELSGLTSDEYDVSELTDLVPGFVVARETDAASVIGVLSMAYFFDPAEWDGKLRFVKRGGNSVLSINGDDLVRRDGDPFERERAQEAEFLRRSTISYIDPAAAYGPTTQKWERRSGTVRAMGESSFEVPVTLDGDAAATIAKRRGLIPWGEPDKQKLSLPYRLAALTPTDIITYTSDDSEIHTIRLMQTEDDSGVRQIESSDNCAEAYSATATGSVPKPPTITEVNLLGPTILQAMNLDSLQAQDNVAGMYFAATGISPGWPGCIVEMSKDSGDTFEPIVTITSPATMGYLLDAIGTSVIDSNGDPIPPEPIPVFLYANGQLSSVTPAQITAGVNAAAIITANVAEIIQFETATAFATATYDLTDTIRGVGETSEASHLYGDAFVLLNSAVIFVPIDSGLAGTTLIFRAVTVGTPSDSAISFPVPYDPPTFVIDGGEIT